MKDATVITQKYAHMGCPSGRLQEPKLAYIVFQSGLGAEFSSDIYVDQRYEKKLFMAWQNVSISLCTWKAYYMIFSFILHWIDILICHVDVWLYETVDIQHVLKVVFSSLLSEALPRFAADSTKPASFVRNSSLQNTYVINTAGALRIPKSHPIHLSRFLILRNSCLKIVYTRNVEVIWPGARKMAKLFSK